MQTARYEFKREWSIKRRKEAATTRSKWGAEKRGCVSEVSPMSSFKPKRSSYKESSDELWRESKNER